jgi:hypothetical protein
MMRAALLMLEPPLSWSRTMADANSTVFPQHYASFPK